MSIIKDALALPVTLVSKETSYMVWETDKLTQRANCYLFLLVTEENVQIHHLFNYRKILNATLSSWDLYQFFFSRATVIKSIVFYQHNNRKNAAIIW